MKNLLLMFLSFIILSAHSFGQTNQKSVTSQSEDLQIELQEFLKMRDKMYNDLLNDSSVFDDNAKALIKRLMKNQNISGLGHLQDNLFKFKFVWTKNVLTIFDVTSDDEFEIKVDSKFVLITGKHKTKDSVQAINQTIEIPSNVIFKNHKIEFKSPNFVITFSD